MQHLLWTRWKRIELIILKWLRIIAPARRRISFVFDVWIYQFGKRNLLTQYNTFAQSPWKYLDKSAQISAEY